MMSLTRWQPFQEMASLSEMVDRLVSEAFGWPWTRNGEVTLPLDIIERENELIVRAAMPGFSPEQIDVSVQGNVLYLRGNAHEEREEKSEQYYLHELRDGSFRRSVRLPVDVDAEKASAEYKHGILTLRLPKSETAVGRRIPIKS